MVDFAKSVAQTLHGNNILWGVWHADQHVGTDLEAEQAHMRRSANWKCICENPRCSPRKPCGDPKCAKANKYIGAVVSVCFMFLIRK